MKQEYRPERTGGELFSLDGPITRRQVGSDEPFDKLGGVNAFLTLDNYQRIALLGEYARDTPLDSSFVARTLLDKQTGLLVIKPEASRGKALVVDFLFEKYGIVPIFIKDFTYSLEEYLSVYLKTIETYPDSFSDILAPLILHHTTHASSVIVFRNFQDYRETYQGTFGSIPAPWLCSTCSDTINDFKRIVAGSGSEPVPHSLRRALEPLIERDGYHTFTEGVAMAINIESKLQLRSVQANRVTFNGIHSPESVPALEKCLGIIFKPIEIDSICSQHVV